MENFNTYEANMNNFAYQSVVAFSMAVSTNIQSLMSLLMVVPSLAQIPLILYQNFEAAKAEEKLSDKEIFTIGEVPKAPGLIQAKASGNKDPTDQKAMKHMAA